MTWKEFKDKVEQQMQEQNISENDRIWYIDWPGSYDDSKVDVYEDEAMGITIS